MTTQAHPSPSVPSLLKDVEFIKFWTGQTISVFGSAITNLALPLTAVNALNATPAQMGFLQAAGMLPFLLIGLFAGVWIDRSRRRPIMLAADLGRAVFLALIPASMALHFLRMEMLYAIIFIVGVLTVFFDVSYQAFLPALVSRERLVEGNSKMETSASAANIAGPGMAGWLIQFLGAPYAIALDAASFLVSAFSLGILRVDEPQPTQNPGTQPDMRREITEGLQVVFKNCILWSIAGATATSNFFGSVWGSIFILYMSRDLHLTPGVIGIIFASGAPGALVGSLIAGRVSRRLGLGAAIIGGMFTIGFAGVFILLAHGSALLVSVMLVLGGFFLGLGAIVYNINQVSLRQSITPDHLLGRMNASMRFLVWGTIPLGAFAASGLSTLLGVWPTIVTGLVGTMLAFLWVLFSPVRGLRETPHPPAA